MISIYSNVCLMSIQFKAVDRMQAVTIEYQFLIQGASVEKTGIILVNLGTPGAPTPSAIRVFLRRFLSDQRVVPLPRLFWWPILNFLILPFRSKKLVKQYTDIWLKDGSPLEVYTKNLAEKINVRYAMSYSRPFLSDVIQQCLDEQCTNLTILPLYPQYASSTTGAVFDQVFKTLNKKRFIPSLTLINNYHLHPDYIKALANSVIAYWQQHQKPQKLIMSFHGIPQNSVTKGDPYASQCEATAQALADALLLETSEWQLVYQSRFGKARWLQPYCDKTLQALPAQGVTDVHVICPGFSMDCLETLEEISKTNREIFMQAGGKSYAYIPALNASAWMCELLIQFLKI